MMQGASADQVFIRSTDMEIFFRGQEAWLANQYGRILADSHSLSLLDHFDKPLALREALEGITANRSSPPQKPYMKAQLNQEAQRLIAHGFLLDHRYQSQAMNMDLGSFDSAESHVRMLNDHNRTTAFRKALLHIVKPDSIVLDIGTGTGILAAFAAQAGAKHVFAIERSPIMARLACQFIESNKLRDQVSIVQGAATAVDFQEKVDCIIGELIGNDPLSERVISIFDDARNRFGKRDCALIPSHIDLYALPLEKSSENQPSSRKSWIYPQKLNKKTTLGAAAKILRIDLSRSRSEAVDVPFNIEFSRTGELNAMMLCFTLELTPAVSVSTLPDLVGQDNHWMTLVWNFSRSTLVETGQRAKIRYTYDKINHSYFEIL